MGIYSDTVAAVTSFATPSPKRALLDLFDTSRIFLSNCVAEENEPRIANKPTRVSSFRLRTRSTIRNKFTFYRKDGLDVPCFIRMKLSHYDGNDAIRVDFNLLESDRDRQAIYCCAPFDNEEPVHQLMSSSMSQRSVSVSDSGWPERAEAVNRDLEALDRAVFLHMKAFHRAAKAGRLERKQQASQDI